MMSITHANSEISDGTPPVSADSEARAERFLQKRKFISDRADQILYSPILTLGREDSDASRRFITWDIEIYNQITLNRFRVSKILIKIQETAGRHTADNLALTAGRIRAPHPRPDNWGRGCVSAWSLCDMRRPEKFQESAYCFGK